MSRGIGMNGSESEIFIDPAYLGLGINPFSISSSGLKISVRPASPMTQAAVKDAWDPWYKGERLSASFTSGLLSTEKSFSQRYGYFEARVKVPALTGGWPSFWLLGAPGHFDEIDVFEILTGDPHVQYGGHQWGQIGTDQKQNDRFTQPSPDLSQEFHTYGVLWTHEKITYYRDDLEIAAFANKGINEPMYMIISIGMDGDWNKKEGFVAAPDAQGDLKVDYVRAFRLKANGDNK